MVVTVTLHPTLPLSLLLMIVLSIISHYYCSIHEWYGVRAKIHEVYMVEYIKSVVGILLLEQYK